MSATQGYECDNDVVQDYYVYVHKDRAADIPFYVGKGRTKRAWSQHRNDLWLNKVKKLEDGFDVVIVEDKLTESEAHDLEINLILKYKRIDEGGTLVNKSPGHGMAFVLGFPVEGEEHDERTLVYRKVTNEQKHELAQGILDKMHHLQVAYNQVTKRSEDDTDLEGLLDDTISQVQTATEDVRTRKATYPQLCDVLREVLSELEAELKDPCCEQGNTKLVTLACRVETFLRERVGFVTADGTT